MSWAAVIVGAISIGTGIYTKEHAKAQAKKLDSSRPEYSTDPNATAELDLAESELASGGVSSRAQTAYNNLNNQQFSSSLSAILRGGGSVNNVADVFGENEEGRTRLAFLSDQMRMQKINNLVAARRYMAEQEDKKFLYNVDAPWKNAVAATGVARENADKQIWSGVDTAGAGISNYFTGQKNDKQFQQYLDAMNGTGSNATGRQPTRWGQDSSGRVGDGTDNGIIPLWNREVSDEWGYSPSQIRTKRNTANPNFNYDAWDQISEGMYGGGY